VLGRDFNTDLGVRTQTTR